MSDTTEAQAAAASTTRLTHPSSEQAIEVAGDISNYLANGWRVATPEAPKGSANIGAWQAFARSQGFTEDEIAGKTKAELRSALS